MEFSPFLEELAEQCTFKHVDLGYPEELDALRQIYCDVLLGLRAGHFSDCLKHQLIVGSQRVEDRRIEGSLYQGYLQLFYSGEVEDLQALHREIIKGSSREHGALCSFALEEIKTRTRFIQMKMGYVGLVEECTDSGVSQLRLPKNTYLGTRLERFTAGRSSFRKLTRPVFQRFAVTKTVLFSAFRVLQVFFSKRSWRTRKS